MWRSDRSGGPGEHSAPRRQLPRALTVVLSFGLVTALLLGSWAVLKPASGPVSPGSARPAATEPAGTTSATVTRTDPSDLTDAETQATEEPNPFVTAIRAAVGPGMSEHDLDELALTVNLLCVGSTAAQAKATLIEDGMPPATAKAVIENACPVL